MADSWPKGSNRHKKPRQLGMDLDRQAGGLLEHGFSSGKVLHLGFYNDFTDDLLLLATPQARSNLDKSVQNVQAILRAAGGSAMST